MVDFVLRILHSVRTKSDDVVGVVGKNFMYVFYPSIGTGGVYGLDCRRPVQVEANYALAFDPPAVAYNPIIDFER